TTVYGYPWYFDYDVNNRPAPGSLAEPAFQLGTQVSTCAPAPVWEVVITTPMPSSQGTVVLNADAKGGFIYNPAPNFTGSATFSYQLRDVTTGRTDIANVVIV